MLAKKSRKNKTIDSTPRVSYRDSQVGRQPAARAIVWIHVDNRLSRLGDFAQSSQYDADPTKERDDVTDREKRKTRPTWPGFPGCCVNSDLTPLYCRVRLIGATGITSSLANFRCGFRKRPENFCPRGLAR
jgi:hypothetical protein